MTNAEFEQTADQIAESLGTYGVWAPTYRQGWENALRIAWERISYRLRGRRHSPEHLADLLDLRIAVASRLVRRYNWQS